MVVVLAAAAPVEAVLEGAAVELDEAQDTASGRLVTPLVSHI